VGKLSNQERIYLQNRRLEWWTKTRSVRRGVQNDDTPAQKGFSRKAAPPGEGGERLRRSPSEQVDQVFPDPTRSMFFGGLASIAVGVLIVALLDMSKA
jgi:hypothetical protein